MLKYVHHVHYVVHNRDAMVDYLEKTFGMKPDHLVVYEDRGMKDAFEFITIYGLLCLQGKEAPRMASVRCTDGQSRPTECLDCPSVTREALQALVPPCAAAFQAPVAAWRLAGTPRTARPVPVSQHCPLPTPEDRLFCRLPSLKTSALQVVPGRVCGRGQSPAPQWRHVLFPALRAARRPRGDAPPRARTALAPRRGVSEAAAAPGVVPLLEEPGPVVPVPAAAPAAPLWPMTGRHGAAAAPKTLRTSRRGRAARQRTRRDTRSCGSRPSARCSC